MLLSFDMFFFRVRLEREREVVVAEIVSPFSSSRATAKLRDVLPLDLGYKRRSQGSWRGARVAVSPLAMMPPNFGMFFLQV
jgi:hypothetical protein